MIRLNKLTIIYRRFTDYFKIIDLLCVVFKIKMIKTLFNIILFVVGLGSSAHANDFQLLNSDLEHSIGLDASNEVYKFSTSHHVFFDLQTQDFSVVSIADTEPSQSEETSIDSNAICHRSNYLSNVQRAQFVLAAHSGFDILHLKKTLFPFHSFW